MMPLAMVGRSGELAELARAWSVVAARTRTTAQPVVLTGAAGVGKSLLVSAALDSFTPPPSTVLAGAARLHTPAPYDWLAATLSGRDNPDELPVPADALAWLAQQPGESRERYAPAALLRLAVRAVRALVGAGPAVLVVEDLHALDPASLNLIGELAAVPDLPALLVVVSRPPEVAVNPGLAARTLARLTGAPGAVRQHLGPLTPDEVAEILNQVYADRPVADDEARPVPDDGAGPVPDEVARAVWRRTGGNPYWLTELLATAGAGSPKALLASQLPAYLRLPEVRADPPPSPVVASADLTAREMEVLSHLAAGMSNKQIARALGISVRTVTVHVSNLLRKTGTASRTEAALWALRHQPLAPVPAPADPSRGQDSRASWSPETPSTTTSSATRSIWPAAT
ncbi:LuxR C-terminal-related transcriptional regulator [Plantactinospora sp. GCM10030261]|uniref:LuxR C-terminal-related transcriptional regulator n=1 Tax=Plantactinospora sp. GCM10030261 TaxID=3273420 RepID=UPI003605BDF7